jgi:hypothetical protein
VSCSVPRLDAVPRPKRQQTLAELAFVNLRGEFGGGLGGTLKASKKASEALTTAACLAIAAHLGAAENGGWPSQAEYARYWKISERQAQREWAVFKQAFPREDSPDRLAKFLVTEYRARVASEDPSFVFSVPAAAAA